MKFDWKYVRDQARRRLAALPEEGVLSAVAAWVDQLDPGEPKLDHHLYEALGVFESNEAVNVAFLKRLLTSKTITPGPMPQASSVDGAIV